MEIIIFMPKVITISFLILLVLISFIIIITDNTITTMEDECKLICESNDLIYYKYRVSGYGNDICYCKDSNNGISTRVI